MDNINLLPWKEKQKHDKKAALINHAIYLNLSLIVALFVAQIILLTQFISVSKDKRSLENQLNALLNKYSHIEKLKNKEKRDGAKIIALKNMQNARQKTIESLIWLSNSIPHNVYFTQITLKNDSLHITGNSKNQNDISLLISKLDNAKFLESTRLIENKSRAKLDDNHDNSTDFILYSKIKRWGDASL